ncbi:hypothetical protein RUND412_007641 [Rhizina undulata]
MAPSSKAPLFKSSFDNTPDFNVPSSNLFTPTPRGRDKDSSPNANLFAGATPGMKSLKSGGGLFGNRNGNSSSARFGFGASSGGLFSSAEKSSGGSSFFGSPSDAQSSPRMAGARGSRSGRYSSPTDGDDEEDAGTPRAYGDESRDESMVEGEYSDDVDAEGDTDPYEYNDDDDDDEDDVTDYNEEDVKTDYEDDVNDESIISPKKKDSDDENDILFNAVTEPGELIIGTEFMMGELASLMEPPQRKDLDDEDEDMDGYGGVPEIHKQQEILTETSKLFLEALSSHVASQPKNSNIGKAHYILSLLLPINHSQAPITETLRRWITLHHAEPTRPALQTLRLFHPNCVLSPDYWEMIQKLTLRGEVQEVIGLLKKADWNAISTDAPEVNLTLSKLANQKAPTERRYAREEIVIIKEAVDTAIRVLENCPVSGSSSYAASSSHYFFPPCVPEIRDTPAAWRIWRGRVIAATEELGRLAAGQVEEEMDDGYYQPFRVRKDAFGLQREKRTELPGEVYKALKLVYDILSGDRDAIMATAADWKEAVVTMMMWGRAVSTTPGEYAEDEEEDEWEDEEKNLELEYDYHGDTDTWTIKPFARERDIKRLQRTVESVTEDMPFNQTSAIECAVAGLMAGDFSFLRILGRYSLLVAAVIVEIGGWGGWIPRLPLEGEDTPLLDEFDEDERELFRSALNEGEELQRKSERVLRRYAAGLFGVEWVNEEREVEGWEVGVGVLGRARGSMKEPGELLTKLELSSKSRVEKLLLYCKENALENAASQIAASFADHLSLTPHSHGDTLTFYALSSTHRPSIHHILTTLLTRTLLQSSPYPPTASLDPTLKTLLASPESCPTDALRFELSGYAAIRAFYESRAKGDDATAVHALVAAIRSAGEKFDGGVWDSEWESAIESWMVLTLLGELLPFLNGKKRVLTLPEMFDVLKVITDLEGLLGETHVWRDAEEFLKSVLEAYGRRWRIREEVESGSGSSWELVKEGIEIEWEEEDAEGVEVDQRDWRRGLVGVGVGGREVVRMVRFGLSREIARAWLEGEE